jgi:hypothetical protein
VMGQRSRDRTVTPSVSPCPVPREKFRAIGSDI